MNIYLFIVLLFMGINYLLDIISDYLNVKHIKPEIPAEFKDSYDDDKYKKSQEYLRDNTKLGIISETITTSLLVIFILAGGFNYIDLFARSLTNHYIYSGLIFIIILLLLSQLMQIPFTLYNTFVTEEKYGFNKMNLKTFIKDTLKGLFLSIIILAVAFSLVIWLFTAYTQWAWLMVWLTISTLKVFLYFIAPVVIMPLFNKFKPLQDGELKDKITKYLGTVNYSVQGIYTMDGSKRSTKANAYFTGFGRFRRIVLYDTLIKNHTTDEIVGVLAHEIGHYKHKHVPIHLGLSLLMDLMVFYLLTFFLNNPELFAAFKMDNVSVYASLLFFSFLYQPLNTILNIASSYLSRKFEFTADKYAVTTSGLYIEFINALKRLSVDTLSNLNPHPWYVFMNYSHPPVLQRIKRILKIKK